MMFDGLFDDLIDIASGYNLLTPLFSFFQDWIPHTKFGVLLLAGFSKREVRQTLERAGVNLWGDIDDADGYTIIFNVREDQTQLALNTLEEAQIPVLYPKWIIKKTTDSFLGLLFEAIGRYT
jgi:hypothetical protein